MVGLRPILGGGGKQPIGMKNMLVGWLVLPKIHTYQHPTSRSTGQSKDSVAALPNVGVVRVTGIRLTGGIHWVTTPVERDVG